MGKSSKTTVSYKHLLDMHFVLHDGVCDKLVLMRGDEKLAYSPSNGISSGTFTIDKPDLYGGKEREGGLEGTMELLPGGPSQAVNTYLQGISPFSANPSLVPAYRGVTSIIARQFNFGNNPYLKPVSFESQRILLDSDGSAQWNPTKAVIAGDNLFDATGIESLNNATTADLGDIAAVSLSSVNAYEWISRTATEEYRAITSSNPPGDLTDNGNGFLDDFYIVAFNGNSNYVAGFYADLSQVISGSIANPEVRITLDYGRTDLGGLQTGASSLLIRSQSAIGGLGTGTLDYDSGNLASATTTDWTELDTGWQSVTDTPYIKFVFNGRRGHVFRNMRISLRGDGEVIANDMNPAHIIREALSNNRWGLGFPDADIDATSFEASADALFDENFGLSYLHDPDTATPLDLIRFVLAHVNGVVYVDRTDGKFHFDLIRDDYTTSDITYLTDADILDLDISLERRTEIPNYLTVNYYNRASRKNVVIAELNVAAARETGSVISSNLNMDMCCDSDLAGRILHREIRAQTVPKYKGIGQFTRAASGLHPGDVVQIDSTVYELTARVFRVLEVDEGDGRQNRVQLQLVEDFFSLEDASTIEQPTRPADPIITTAQPVTIDLTIEAPYYEIVQRLGDSGAQDTIDENNFAGFILSAPTTPGSGHINARVNHADTAVTPLAYDQVDVADFSPRAVLSADVGKDPTQNLTFGLTSGSRLAQVELGTLAQVGDEIVRVDSFSTDLSQVTVGRGCLDTAPAEHSSGAEIIFFDDFAEVAENLYEGSQASGASDVIAVKYITVTGSDALTLAEDTQRDVTMQYRAIRPYRPNAFQVEASYAPLDFQDGDSLTWEETNRLTQTTSTINDFADTGVASAEANTDYELLYYEVDQDNNVSASTYFTESTALTTLALDATEFKDQASATAREARIEINTRRDFGVTGATAFEAWQRPYLQAPIFEALITEDGEAFLTEETTFEDQLIVEQ